MKKFYRAVMFLSILFMPVATLADTLVDRTAFFCSLMIRNASNPVPACPGYEWAISFLLSGTAEAVASNSEIETSDPCGLLSGRNFTRFERLPKGVLSIDTGNITENGSLLMLTPSDAHKWYDSLLGGRSANYSGACFILRSANTAADFEAAKLQKSDAKK